MEHERSEDRGLEREDLGEDPSGTPETRGDPHSTRGVGERPAEDAAEERAADRADERLGGTSAPLLEERDAADLRRRWEDLQASFVDRPREAVEQADRLVDEVVRRVSEGLASRRSMLEARWSQGEEASTEDLRLAMQSYRSFFERMLTTGMVAES